MEELSLSERIYVARHLMIKYGELFGLTHEYTLKFSRLLDELILEEQKLHGVKMK